MSDRKPFHLEFEETFGKIYSEECLQLSSETDHTATYVAMDTDFFSITLVVQKHDKKKMPKFLNVITSVNSDL